MRHGCLAVIALALVGGVEAVADSPNLDNVRIVDTRIIDLDYAVDADSGPLVGVELWYTFDNAATWELYGRDMDLTPPMSFYAPQEGLCGFYFILSNEHGSSDVPPSTTTEPHVQVLFDVRPPLAQLNLPTITYDPSGRATAKLTWTAIDDSLAERPIDLAYRLLPEGAWRDVARELPNASSYDWAVPEAVYGQMMFRVTVRDRAGHQSQAASAAVTIDSPQSRVILPATPIEPARQPRVPSPEDMERAHELLRKGRRHQLHGQFDLAIARLCDALALDPAMPEALVAMGGSLYALGKYEPSIQAFELALNYTPGDRGALEGLARSLVATKQYEMAESRLLDIVDARPDDVETWLHLGDIAIYRGNEIAAREYYLKAATRSPEAVAVAARARARLDDLPTLHRRYRGTDTQ